MDVTIKSEPDDQGAGAAVVEDYIAVKVEPADDTNQDSDVRYVNIKTEEIEVKDEHLRTVTVPRLNTNTHSSHTEKQLCCKVCEFQATMEGLLRTRGTSPAKQKTFACDVCVYKTVKKHNIIRHQMMHAGEKPFACGSCEFKASSKASLRRHIKNNKACTVK